jgi:hypothetical protein
MTNDHSSLIARTHTQLSVSTDPTPPFVGWSGPIGKRKIGSAASVGMEGVSSPRADIGVTERGNVTMTRDETIIRSKVGVLELAKRHGNISQACRIMGLSRDSQRGGPHLSADLHRYRQ